VNAYALSLLIVGFMLSGEFPFFLRLFMNLYTVESCFTQSRMKMFFAMLLSSIKHDQKSIEQMFKGRHCSLVAYNPGKEHFENQYLIVTNVFGASTSEC